MDVRAALKSQYHAALAMLKEAIERCPDELWTAAGPLLPVWHVAYHTLYYTHCYLQQDYRSFVPWEHDRAEYWSLGPLPWLPHREPNIGEPYTKDQLLAYLAICDAMVDGCLDALDLDAAQCGFPWYPIPTLEHQLVNLRHIQHHMAQLGDRIRAATGSGVEWVGHGEAAA